MKTNTADADIIKRAREFIGQKYVGNTIWSTAPILTKLCGEFASLELARQQGGWVTIKSEDDLPVVNTKQWFTYKDHYGGVYQVLGFLRPTGLMEIENIKRSIHWKYLVAWHPFIEPEPFKEADDER